MGAGPDGPIFPLPPPSRMPLPRPFSPCCASAPLSWRLRWAAGARCTLRASLAELLLQHLLLLPLLLLLLLRVLPVVLH